MSQVWDCFLFNDEIELLSFRLSELESVVDRFVVIESAETFTRQRKPLHFSENKELFAQYSRKIEHVVVESFPASLTSPWDRERAQRAAARNVLAAAPGDTLVILGDVDEVPRRGVVSGLSRNLEHPRRLILAHCIFFANWRIATDWIDGPKVSRANQLDSAEMSRHLGDPEGVWDPRWDVDGGLQNAGWHLSYLGGVEAIQKKFREFAHQEYNNERDAAEAHLDRCVRLAVDFRGRWAMDVIAVGDLDPMLARFRAQRPHLFRDEAGPEWKRHLYQSYARARWRMPSSVARWADNHLALTLALVGAPLIVVDELLHLSRRIRSSRHESA